MSKASFVLGYVGPTCSLNVRKVWNGFLAEEGSDGMFDFYRARDVHELELRLSEMFVHQRRGYVLHTTFSESVLPLLDSLDQTAENAMKVDTVVNQSGLLVGYFFGCSPVESMHERLALWVKNDATQDYVT